MRDARCEMRGASSSHSDGRRGPGSCATHGQGSFGDLRTRIMVVKHRVCADHGWRVPRRNCIGGLRVLPGCLGKTRSNSPIASGKTPLARAPNAKRPDASASLLTIQVGDAESGNQPMPFGASSHRLQFAVHYFPPAPQLDAPRPRSRSLAIFEGIADSSTPRDVSMTRNPPHAHGIYDVI